MSVNLGTDYLGIHLASPIVASASPLTGQIETLQRLEAAGVAAVVLPSLFEEEIVAEAFEAHKFRNLEVSGFAEANSYLPAVPDMPTDVDRYLSFVAHATQELSIPVIASLNGFSRGGWVRYATELVEAGASAIELNVYLMATDPAETGASVEERIVDLVYSVCNAVPVPVAVKLSPFFSALGNLADSMVGAGAKGLVLFNRFYQPDIDIDSLDIQPSLDLSTPADLRLPLRWIGVLRDRLPCSLALSGGVHSSRDVIKGLLAGADVVMSTSALLRFGPEQVREFTNGLTTWLEDNEYESVEQMRGSLSQGAVPDPDAYERSNYLKVLRHGGDRYLPRYVIADK